MSRSATSPLERSLDQIVDRINRLVTVLILSEKCVQSEEMMDPYTLADGEARMDIDTDEDYVRAKYRFNDSVPWLYERLGAAMTKRRQYLLWKRSQRTDPASNDTAPSIDDSHHEAVREHEDWAAEHYSAETIRRISSLYTLHEPGVSFQCPCCQTQQIFESERSWR